ncbi:MAG: transcription termination factor NusA [Desulfurella sp.]|uniref:transcription termination factor NusA n=1 Tax=Desulfurella sp. TaxID=1962857 RepID=UPI003C9F5041
MKEIFEIANLIAKEHNINSQAVIESLAEAIKISISKKYGDDSVVKTSLDSSNRVFNIFIEKKVVEKAKNNNEISLEEAKKIDPNANIGDYIDVEFDPEELGRIAVSTAKNVMSKMFKDLEKRVTYEDYSKKIGKIVSGEIWSIGVYNDCIVDFKNAIGILPKKEQSPGDKYIVGETIKAYAMDVLEEPKGVKLILSRTHPGFVKELFMKEVPEVRDGSVEIKAIAREPSKRTKVAVYSKDSKIDPIGTCVGAKGTRISAVVKELGDEKVDVIRWSANLSIYIKNALAPSKVSYIELFEDEKRAKVYVPDEEFSAAIGKMGVNAKLVAKLTGVNIDIIKESEMDKTGHEEKSQKTKEDVIEELMFIESITFNLANKLYENGIKSIEQLKTITLDELESIKGVGEKRAKKIYELLNEIN